MEPLIESENKNEEEYLNFTFEKNIIFKKDFKNLEIKIYDIVGREIEDLKFKYIKRDEKIEFKNLKKGVYFIDIKMENKRKILKKVIIK